MFTSQPPLKESQHITPPSGFVGAPLTPPPTDEKAFTQVPRVIALLGDTTIKIRGHPFSLHDETERRLRQDESLFGFVKDKIRYVASGGEEAPADDASRTDMTMMAGGIDLLFACLLSCTKVERF
jgi:hypothetical protein